MFIALRITWSNEPFFSCCFPHSLSFNSLIMMRLGINFFFIIILFGVFELLEYIDLFLLNSEVYGHFLFK
jgi:hypothetical protein